MTLKTRTGFEESITNYEKELLLHCYRFTGSLQDSEDLLQETMLKAWRKRDSLKSEAGLRAWLYKIATNVCLDHLKGQKRRALPMEHFPPADPQQPFPPPSDEYLWLEPFPDALLGTDTTQPEQSLLQSEHISLAFMASIQWLPATQRAALILVDVLDWSVEETALTLDVSVSAANSLLYRARKRLRGKVALEGVPTSASEESDLLRKFVEAWERADAEALSELLREDARFHMPPFPCWYAGREAITTMVANFLFDARQPDAWKLKPLGANGQPGALLSRRDENGQYTPFGLMVLTLGDGEIVEIAAFLDPALTKWVELA